MDWQRKKKSLRMRGRVDADEEEENVCREKKIGGALY